MKRSIQVELWKAFHNCNFIMSLVIGLALTACNVIPAVRTVRELTISNLEMAQRLGASGLGGFHSCSLFIWWIACNGVTFGSTYFYQVWPILAALPYAWSYAQEAKCGSIVQFAVRENKREYFFSKYLAVFISGGVAVTIPVVTDLLVNALFCPDIKLNNMEMLTAVCNINFQSRLYYLKPWVFAAIWCAMEFLWGGAAASLCFLAGTHWRFPILVVLVPFIILYCTGVIGVTVSQYFDSGLMLNPIQLAMAVPWGGNPEWLVFTVLGGMILLSLGVGYRRVVKHDIL